MRKLMWLTLGFGWMQLVLAYSMGREGSWFWLGGALGLALLIPAAFYGKQGWRRGVAALLGALLGFGWFSFYQSRVLNTALDADGTVQPCTIAARDYSVQTDYGMRVEGMLDLEGRRWPVRVYLDAGTSVEPGELLTGEFSLKTTLPGENRPGTYHSGMGIFLLAYQQGNLVRQEGEASWENFPVRLRHRLAQGLDASLPADAAPFAKALLLGQTQDLDYATDTALKISGIRHIAAVSGLHISILFAVISRLCFRRRFWMAVIGLPTLALFAAVAGFTPSVVRACIMSGLMLLAMLAEQEYDGPTALSAAALAMLVCYPMVITSVSFQLSAASVAGIFAVSGRIRTWLLARIPGKRGKGLRHWLAGSVSISLGAQLFTTPLCAWYFGSVSLIGIVTNLLVLWLVSGIFCAVAAVGLLGLAAPGAAAILGGLTAWPIRLVLGIACALAKFPLAAVYTNSVYIVCWLVFLYLLLGVWLLGKSRQPLVLVSCGVIGLCAALCASWLEPQLDGRVLTVLDVGQGQCLLLQDAGRTFLVDCGGDRDAEAADLAAQTLLSQGITRLDGVIVTHMDRDHAGGIGHLLSRVDTDLLVLPPEQPAQLIATKGQVIYAAQDLALAFADTRIRILTPTYPGNANENSLCILFDGEKCAILITGDRNAFGERLLLRQRSLPKVDVLIAGHHGAANATCQELLDAVQPDIVCISAGKDNPYGHPNPDTLSRLAAQGCQVYRTDQNGTIIIRRNAHGQKAGPGE